METLLGKVREVKTIEEAERLLFSNFTLDSETVLRALSLSKKAHKGQTRIGGCPYITHPILVATIVSFISNDEVMVVSALLHDVVEDTDYTIEEIENLFGKDVAFLVEGVTKIRTIRNKKSKQSNSSALTFRKMLLSSIKDPRILVLKLCDRLHNMLTLHSLPHEKRIRISQETMVVYAPIAYRLGVSQLKNILEDLSFYYLYPEDYKRIDDYINNHRQDLQLKLNKFVQKIRDLMFQNGFKVGTFDVFGRIKHYHSMFQKMQRKGIGIDEILDLIAIRILVQKDIDCYVVLGLLHINFKPVISRFKDYITLPKENGYSTIHTTLFDDGIVESQIRTYDMHKTAEYGIAAHWKYKSDESKLKSVNLEWLESLQYQNENVEEFYALAKNDLFSDDISVYSPAGERYTLPKDSVALDFAYSIHSEIGDTAKGALVNKEKSELLRILKNGDMVKILTGDEATVHCSWLNSVKTSKAKEGIKNACRRKVNIIDRLSAINIFSELLNITADDTMTLFDLCVDKEKAFKLTSNQQIYKTVLSQLRDADLNLKKFMFPEEVVIEHLKFVTNKPIKNIEFNYCCHPKIGDQIVAFYENEEVTIHHKFCNKAFSLMQQHKGMVFVSWVSNKSYRYQLIIGLKNRKGILADLLHKLAMIDLNVLSIELGIRDSEKAEFCKIEVETKEHNGRKLKEKLSKRFKLIDLISLNDAYNK